MTRRKHADFARPYDERDDKVVAIPFRDISTIGPAGSINSNVEDMARWLIVQTHKGKIDGKQILSAAVLADIHTPHMTTGVPAGTQGNRAGRVCTRLGRRRLSRPPPRASRRSDRRFRRRDDPLSR